MNCPSRVDPEFPEGYNQNPNALNADATTRADLGFIGNAKARDDHTIDHLGVYEGTLSSQPEATDDGHAGNSKVSGLRRRSDVASGLKLQRAEERIGPSGILHIARDDSLHAQRRGIFAGAVEVVRKYTTFIGPGFMVAVAYIDPGKSRCYPLAQLYNSDDQYMVRTFCRC
jgi:metal iron transporter